MPHYNHAQTATTMRGSVARAKNYGSGQLRKRSLSFYSTMYEHYNGHCDIITGVGNSIPNSFGRTVTLHLIGFTKGFLISL